MHLTTERRMNTTVSRLRSISDINTHKYIYIIKIT